MAILCQAISGLSMPLLDSALPLINRNYISSYLYIAFIGNITVLSAGGQQTVTKQLHCSDVTLPPMPFMFLPCWLRKFQTDTLETLPSFMSYFPLFIGSLPLLELHKVWPWNISWRLACSWSREAMWLSKALETKISLLQSYLHLISTLAMNRRMHTNR